jgi:D-glucosaminate-6-phosphate ammonia-lyase
LPPAENLRYFIGAGADLVSISGGKAIRGPQATGILCGRRDLIASVLLQNQDMDVHPEAWSYRSRYLEPGIMPGPPHQGVGRGFKVGKEEIVGLVTALKIYAKADHAAERARWERLVRSVLDGVADLPSVTGSYVSREPTGVPQAHLKLDERALGRTAFDLVQVLLGGAPRIAVNEGLARRGTLIVSPLALRDDDIGGLVEGLRTALTAVR